MVLAHQVMQPMSTFIAQDLRYTLALGTRRTSHTGRRLPLPPEGSEPFGMEALRQGERETQAGVEIHNNAFGFMIPSPSPVS